VTFLLFEGSVALAALLAFAEILTWWGVLAIPATVAVIVKLHDVVAGAFIRPLAVAQLRTPRLLEAAAMGRSVVPRPSRLTTEIGDDDAVADPGARPSTRIVAPMIDLVSTRRPMPAAREPEPAGPAMEAAEPPLSALEAAEPPLRAMETAEPHDVVSPPEVTSPPAPSTSGQPDAARHRSRRNQGRFAL
jgi:hypothetical protein